MSLNRLKGLSVPLGLIVNVFDNPIKHTCVHSECISDSIFETSCNLIAKTKRKRQIRIKTKKR